MLPAPGTPGESTPATSLLIERRPLTPTEAGLVIDEIQASATITGYSFDEWTRTRETMVMTDLDTDELIGVTLAHHLVGGWTELAVLYVLAEHRGHGHGPTLLAAAVRDLRASGRRVLLFFCDDHMRHLATRTGFVVHEDEGDFRRGSVPRHLFIRAFYKPQWLASPYRRRELRRKRAELRCDFTFKIAVLDD